MHLAGGLDGQRNPAKSVTRLPAGAILLTMAGCPACGAPSDPVDRFCGRCGTGLVGIAPVTSDLARFCSGCGASLEADARFCRRCGAQAPEPPEDVFADMVFNGHDILTDTETMTGLVAGASSASPQPRPESRDAVTESIPVPEPSAPPSVPRPRPSSPPAPGAAEARRSRAEDRVATATIERTPVRRVAAPAEAPQAPAPMPRGIEEPHEAPLPRGAGFPWGGTLALIGALGVILSSILDWGGPFSASLPRDISAAWLLDPNAPAIGPSLGLVMLFAGTLGALVTLVGMAAPRFTFLRRIVALLTLFIPMAFALRTLQSPDEQTGITDLPSALGVGVWVAAAGALVELAAGRTRRAAHL